MPGQPEYAGHDDSLAQSFQLAVRGSMIEFQFPPKITNDSRKGDWTERAVPGSDGPIATIAKPQAHTYTITWVYIVDGGTWPSSRVHKNLMNLRKYWAYDTDSDLIVFVQFWGIGGQNDTSGRITNIDVKYGETIVGNGNEAFPLRSDVTVELKLWYTGGEKGGSDSTNDPQVVQDVPSLLPNPEPDWY